MNPAATLASSAAVTPTAPAPGRVASVDALRGWVIALMIFVNDIAGVRHAPSWLKHVDANADAMTLPDIVFPAFLFIVGISIPLAFQRAIQAGETRRDLFKKVLVRTFALLVMGVAMVNMEGGVLVYVALLLAFCVTPAAGRSRIGWLMARALGIGLLIGLVITYQDADGRRWFLGPLFDRTDDVWLRHSWWGILGLIGWVYLAASSIYLTVGNRREWLIGTIGLLTTVYLATHAQWMPRLAEREWLEWAHPVTNSFHAAFAWLNSHVAVGDVFGSLAAIAVAGACLGTTLLPNSDLKTHASRLRWSGGFVAGLLLAALLLDPLFGVNKIRATPTWCLLCAAITAGAWMLLYWRMDVRGAGRWNRIVQPAGSNPLLAYLLHPLVLNAADFVGLPLTFYKSSSVPLVISLAGSLLMSLGIVQLTRAIAATGYRLKV